METEEPQDTTFRSGLIAIIGVPNVGKSTFLNRVLGQKVAITSSKPQTTRDRVAGILSDDETQIVFLDTPGFVEPRDLLHEALVARIREALEGVDGVVYLRDAAHPASEERLVETLLAGCKAPVIEVWNKIDLLDNRKREGFLAGIAQKAAGSAFAISALQGDGLEALLSALRGLLPSGPPLYPLDDVSDRDLRFHAAELVREKVFELTSEELPYSVAAQTEEYLERDEGKDYIRVVIYVERDSQKGMIIGHGGEMLRRIGQAARPEIEALAGRPVYLELHVKVRKKWSKNPDDLRRFGYRLPKNKRRGANTRTNPGGAER